LAHKVFDTRPPLKEEKLIWQKATKCFYKWLKMSKRGSAKGEAGFHRGAEEACSRQSGLNKVKSALTRRAAQPPIRCPVCGSLRAWRDGVRHTWHGDIQRWLCRDCGLRFSESTANRQVEVDITGKGVEQPHPRKDLLQPDILQGDLSVKPGLENPPLKGREYVAPHIPSTKTIVEKPLYTFPDYNSERRVRVSEAEAKNLVEVESQTGVGQREATTQSTATVKGKIVEFAWWMQKQGYKQSTIRTRATRIRRLASLGADLLDPESVKEAIAKQDNWREGTKNIAVVAYSSFLEMLGLTWKPPRYKVPDSLPFIPLETEVDALINSCGKKMACFLQGLKDTGADPGELACLEWTDVNYEAKSVTIRHPVKGHNSRVVPVSEAFLRRLGVMPKKGGRVFCSRYGLSASFDVQRRTAVRKLGNPRLLKISFTTLRHWKGTMEYHKTKDILHVQRLLGHKSVQNTMIYINLEAALFEAESNEFTVRVAKTLDEACSFVEAGFDYVTDMEGAKIFRRRK